MKIRMFIRNNKAFFIVVCIQAVLLAYLVMGLFSSRCVLNIQLESEDGKLDSIENFTDEGKSMTFSSSDYVVRLGGIK